MEEKKLSAIELAEICEHARSMSPDEFDRFIAQVRFELGRITELDRQLAVVRNGSDDLYKHMLTALENVGYHEVTDCDGDEMTVYFCNWQAICDAKRAAQAKQ